ncbi:MAG: hypothetical protein HY865_00975 [Chloroflexi bacterium]|nr:hypothetical protein [Chloroflexota bacterium]
MKPDEVLNFQEYWKAYGYSGDNGEMSARRAFTFAQLQTHRQYLSLQREVEKLRKQVAAQHSVHPTRGSVAQKVSSKSKGSAKPARG